MDSRYRPHTPSTLRTVRSFGAQLGSTLPEERGSSPLFVRASFEVRCETDWGESVAVVGSTAQLGAWRPEAGMRMTTNQRIYPSWRSEPLLLSEVLELEYKFVLDARFEFEFESEHDDSNSNLRWRVSSRSDSSSSSSCSSFLRSRWSP